MTNKHNLSLKLNRVVGSLHSSSPQTPIEQTLSTPTAAPANAFNYPRNAINSLSYLSVALQNCIPRSALDGDDDDILTDIDEPQIQGAAATALGASGGAGGGSSKSIKTYTVFFTPRFDELLVNNYQQIQSIPTNTPFLGSIPPSGLVGKIASETISTMINAFSCGSSNPDACKIPQFDFQSIITKEYLLDPLLQPVFSQLVRKRLLDLCASCNPNSVEYPLARAGPRKDSDLSSFSSRCLPDSTSVDVISSANGVTITSSSHGSNNAKRHHASISNLSLNEININNCKANNPALINQDLFHSRSRSSSLSLRKQSLTRNNSTNSASTSWLHVGNIPGVRPHSNSINSCSLLHHSGSGSISSDSLHSIQDYTSTPFVNRVGGYQTPQLGNSFLQKTWGLPLSTPSTSAGHADQDTRFAEFHFCNPLQNGLETQYQQMQNQSQNLTVEANSDLAGTPHSNSNLNSNPVPNQTSDLTPDLSLANVTIEPTLNQHQPRLPEMSFFNNPPSQLRSFSVPDTRIVSDRSDIRETCLTLDTTSAGSKLALDSPFMSAVTPSEDFEYYSNGFSQIGYNNTDLGRKPGATADKPDPVSAVDSPLASSRSKLGWSRKKRESLNLKRGIL